MVADRNILYEPQLLCIHLQYKMNKTLHKQNFVSDETFTTNRSPLKGCNRSRPNVSELINNAKPTDIKSGTCTVSVLRLCQFK